MNLEMARNFFMWCTIINSSILILWFALFVFAHDSLKALKVKVLRRKIEHFDTLNYAGIGLYKIAIILFNLVPWVVSCCMLHSMTGGQ